MGLDLKKSVDEMSEGEINSLLAQELLKGRTPNFVGVITSPRAAATEPVAEVVDPEAEARWNKYVTHAKVFVKAMNQNRMEIAKAAIAATEFENNGYGKFKKYTLERFANDIGVNYKTLIEYCRVYKNVVSKLPEGTWDGKNFEALRRTSNAVTAKTSPVVVARTMKAELSRNMDSAYFAQYMKRVRTLRYYICEKADLNAIPSNEIEELSSICSQIKFKLQTHGAEVMRDPSRAEVDYEDLTGKASSEFRMLVSEFFQALTVVRYTSAKDSQEKRLSSQQCKKSLISSSRLSET
jgi:hypothetical protein